MKQKLINWLLGKFLPNSFKFVDIKETERVNACQMMKDPSIVKYLSSVLTEDIIAYIYISKEQRDEQKGKINRMVDILNQIDKSSKDALDIRKRNETDILMRKENKHSPYWSIKNKIIKIKRKKN